MPQLPPVLRYRLRARPGDRPSSLAHTGVPLREPGPGDPAGRPGPPQCGVPSAAARHHDAGGVAGKGGGRPSWAEQFPSDFIYRRSPPRGGAVSQAGSAERARAAAAVTAAACAASSAREGSGGPSDAALAALQRLPGVAAARPSGWSPPDGLLKLGRVLLQLPALELPASPGSGVLRGSTAGGGGGGRDGLGACDERMRPSSCGKLQTTVDGLA